MWNSVVTEQFHRNRTAQIHLIASGCSSQILFEICKKRSLFPMEMKWKTAYCWKRMAHWPPEINPFEPILLSQICWDFLFVSCSPSFVSNKIFPVDLQMSLHSLPSRKYSLFHRSYSILSAAHSDEVNRLFLVARLDLIWGHGCPRHSWTFVGMSCLRVSGFPFLVRKDSCRVLNNHS